MAKDRQLERLQVRAKLQPPVLPKAVSHAMQEVKSFGLAARAVERHRDEPDQPLALRGGTAQRQGARQSGAKVIGLELEGEQVLRRRQAQILQHECGRQLLHAQTLSHVSAPQGKRRSEARPGLGGIPRRRGHHGDEPEGVNFTQRGVEPVSP